ncbi:unnamed protein product [Caenorhabditis auriculariae]|uniref:Receptor L-domain domain-containing protein n=1 Tax=Caenorhabditis auriculariae TaxID=2777116 RepID=A0A8S1HY56_9PELO|nr:unnamed protein product [Caenorhabditis auriculariae]
MKIKLPKLPSVAIFLSLVVSLGSSSALVSARKELKVANLRRVFCTKPVFGIVDDETCGYEQLCNCLRDEIVLKNLLGDSLNKGAALALTLLTSSRIELEDNKDVIHFGQLEEISFNATDSQEFPEALIRIRRTNVTEDSFKVLKSINISPLESYCIKGTIFDIDYMHPKPWKVLKDLEKKVLEPCATLLATKPPGSTRTLNKGTTSAPAPQGETLYGAVVNLVAIILWVFLTVGLFLRMDRKLKKQRRKPTKR